MQTASRRPGTARLGRAPSRLSRALAILAVICAAAVGAAANEDIREGLGLLEQGDLAAAESSARKAIEARSDSPDGWLLLGMVMRRTGRNGQAIEAFEKSLAAGEAVFTRKLLGATLFDSGEYWRARAQFEAALQAESNDAMALFYLGRIRLRDGSFEQAAADLERAISAGLRTPEAWLLLARAYLEQGRMSDAAERLDSLVETHPDNLEARLHSASLLIVHAQTEQALERLSRAAELWPEHPAVHVALAEAYLLGPRVESSIEAVGSFVNSLSGSNVPASSRPPLVARAGQVLEQARTQSEAPEKADFLLAEVRFLQQDYEAVLQLLGPGKPAGVSEADYWNLMGMSHAGRNELEAATSCLEAALKADPKRMDLLLNLAGVHQQAGENETALEIFRRITERAPELATAHFGLGLGLFNAGRYSEAAAAFREALSADPLFEQATIYLARSLDEAGEGKKSAALLEEAIRSNPSCEDCIFRLSLHHVARSDLDTAIAQLRRLIGVNPRHPEAHYQLGKALATSGRPEQAIEMLSRAIEVNPDLDAAYYQLGRLYASMGQEERGRKLLRAVAEQKRKRLETFQGKMADQAQ